MVTAGLDGQEKDLIEERTDEDYPYRRTQGADRGMPRLPYVLHHAQPGAGGVWDGFQEIELVEATLDIAAAYTFLQHSLFRASWPQRWGLDVTVAGTVPTSSENGTRSEVPTDPTSLLHLQAVDGAKNPQIGQWGAGIDPVQLETAVERLERALGDIDGMAAGGLIRQSSDPMSAEALIIQQQGQRTAQVRYGAVLRQPDEELLGLIANIANLANIPDRPLPEDGYEVEYRLLALSPTEQAATIERLEKLQAMGLLSPVDAYCELHPGTSRRDAAVALRLIEAERKAFKGPEAPDASSKPEPHAEASA